ncbi:MAG: chemotaxis protein CheC, partial [Lachnospiraceae bacterium]
MDGMLSQDEINALLSGDPMSNASDETEQTAATANEELLTEAEQDAIGEVANISMGTSATTLYSLVNHKVEITTPVVKLAVWQDVLDYYEKPCVFIQIKYTTGLDGHNILILKEHDVKVIA